VHNAIAQKMDCYNYTGEYDQYIGEYLQFFVDTSGECTVRDISKLDQFKSSQQRIPNLGVSSNAIWCKLNIKNLSKDDDFFLNIKQPGIDELSIFQLEGSTLEFKETRLADTTDLGLRFISHPNFALPINILVQTSKTIYFRFETSEQLQIPISVGPRYSIDRENNIKDVYFSFYAGLMLAMLVYNLFILISTKERTYLYYVLYVGLVFMAQTSIQGYNSFVLFSDFEGLERLSVYLFGALAPIAAVLFMMSFLQLKKNGPKFRALFYLGIFTNVFALFLALFDKYQLCYQILQMNVTVMALYQLVIAIILTIRQVPQAKNFLVAWSAFLVGVVVFVLKDFEIVPYNELTYNMMSIGSAVESVLLSFALADRINSLKREKEMSQNRMLIALKENERMISSQNTELERRVGERTTALEQSNLELNSTLRNLKEAQKQLIEAEKLASLGQMTAGIAHELNNPINFVQSNVAPLKRDIDELTELINKVHSGSPLSHNEKLQIEFVHQEINQLLSGIEEGSKRTAEIIRGLRIFSRMDRDSIVSANINDCIQSTLIVMKSNTKGEVTIVKELQNDMPNIECFPGKLNQVLVNLITNAIHATSLPYRNQRDRVIKIRSFRSTNSVVIAIKDNGRGIEETILQKIFDPFFTTKDVGEGTGLGLSIVLGIVKEHNGHIDVQSTLGEGTEFLIYLPLIPESIRSRKAYEQ